MPVNRRQARLAVARADSALIGSWRLRMIVYGIDFTSRPRRGKPITCLACVLADDRLRADGLSEWCSFEPFEAALRRPGPWIAGIDLPFGQARIFIRNIGWPTSWPGYVAQAESLGRDGFRRALDAYRAARPPGDKEHRRATDVAAGAISPQKLYGTPVGLMFYEGAPRLLRAGLTIPGLQSGDPQRVAVEAYPGLLARALIGRRPYKQDSKAKQTPERRQARLTMLQAINDGAVAARYGLRVEAPMTLADDPSGDHLDALLCAVQAAWAWTRRVEGFGAPDTLDPMEGWIADPALLARERQPRSSPV
jgi:hypothetical protein